MLRLNGNVGMAETLNLATWRLQVAGSAASPSHPRYAKDVTAWTYDYTGDMKPDAQANDVKSAPGNGDASKTGDKQGAAGGPNAPTRW